ncbi:substrate-binding domain-containing protein [Streptomyces sp. DSM 44915]|uniref:Substrate-binding domain-containing protein n=1 Tax=Streptomyces chisholmiae TaxID=3075540 RepID=A0ABU2JV38_9ACTN|nr:substrate-binding domain-containing protein [Streptomyces sp. DSM 44915]MDT0268829.1 substrate-binding domain-containing protein [Streptomyces sp. DSM 44915]
MADLLALQRRELLLRELRAAGAVRVAELAARYAVSLGTIRRDLGELATSGALVRVRGGAVLPPGGAPGGPPADRQAVVAPRRPPPGGHRAAVRTIGLLVPSATRFYPPVISGVRAVAARHRARVVIALSDHGQPRDLAQIDELRALGASGLLVAPADGAETGPAVLDRLRATGLPFVLVERRPQDPYDPAEFVVSDHRKGAYAAVAHLAGLGHRRVALLARTGLTAGQVREGHAAAVRALGLAEDAPALVPDGPVAGAPAAAAVGDAFLDSCLASGVSAAVVAAEGDAIMLLQRLRARALRVPADLALVTCDDELAAVAEVPLTTVAPPKGRVGECATRLLLDRLDRPEQEPPRGVVMQPRLVVRRSCGAARD